MFQTFWFMHVGFGCNVNELGDQKKAAAPSRHPDADWAKSSHSTGSEGYLGKAQEVQVQGPQSPGKTTGQAFFDCFRSQLHRIYISNLAKENRPWWPFWAMIFQRFDRGLLVYQCVPWFFQYLPNRGWWLMVSHGGPVQGASQERHLAKAELRVMFFKTGLNLGKHCLIMCYY